MSNLYPVVIPVTLIVVSMKSTDGEEVVDPAGFDQVCDVEPNLVNNVLLC